MAARSLNAYLNSAGDLSRLSAHAGRLVKLQRIFEKIAPDYLAASSRVANFKSGKVVIHADSGAVAAKLRQILPSLTDKLLLEGAEVTEIQVKVQPADITIQPKNRRDTRAPVSVDVKTGLQALADNLPDDAPLKNSLKQLVDRSR
jgi:hypothetical protein